MKNYQTFSISFISIVKFFLVILSLYFLFLIKNVLALIFVALIFAAAIDSWVDWLQNKKIPRGVSVLFIYIIVVAIIAAVIVLIIPPITEQVDELSSQYPQFFEQITDAITSLKEYSSQFGIEQAAGSEQNIGTIIEAAKSLRSAIQNLFNGIISFIVILVITFYMTVQEDAIKKTTRSLAPKKHQDFIVELINKIQKKIGLWLKGQLVLSLVIGILSYVGLLILGVKYALFLALIAAIGEFVPYIGPVISAVPAIFLAFVQSPVKALLVLILFVVIQQLENHLLVPKIMQKAVGLNPIVSVVALLIGLEVGGVLGAILAIPVATAISIVIKELYEERESIQDIRKKSA